MGLMVWRDLDVTVACRSLSIQEVTGIGATLGEHPCVRQVLFRNDTGAWNTGPGYPDGLYLGLSYRSPSGHQGTVGGAPGVSTLGHQLRHLRSRTPRGSQHTRRVR